MQAGAERADRVDLGAAGDGRDEYGCRYAEPVRGVGHGDAVVAPGGRDHSGGRYLAQEQVRKGATRLERARALQLLQFQHDARAGVIVAGAGQRVKRDCQGRGAPQVRSDLLVGTPDLTSADRACFAFGLRCPGHCGCASPGAAPVLTCAMASTSTGVPRGSAATPMAERTCAPAAPRTSSSSCEAPSATCGCCTKSPVQATKTVSLTSRATASRLPAAACSCASTFTAHARAASCPATRSTSAPSQPAATRRPSRVAICPEVWTVLPW